MSELKPCPFCGGEATLQEWKDKTFTPRCYSCRCFLDEIYDTRQEDIKAWNTRSEVVAK